MKIYNKEKVKYFNKVFTIILNKILDNLAEVVQIEFYIASLLPPIAMFVKREKKQTLDENLEETIEVENGLETISNHSENEENKASTTGKNGKKNKETSKTYLDEKDKVILQFHIEIMNMKRNKGKGKKPLKPFI